MSPQDQARAAVLLATIERYGLAMHEVGRCSGRMATRQERSARRAAQEIMQEIQATLGRRPISRHDDESSAHQADHDAVMASLPSLWETP